MKVPQGPYYYPNPKNKKERMYVRENDGSIEFRLWHQDHPQIWDKHGWLDMDIVKRAAGMYEKKGQNPLELYDQDIARALLKQK
ncbi:hypothetical protein [Desulfonatronovibrio hydrogenovorans]|uniref:hypothetical protein n=1 Tax=Desulfonatronovibrio hydrogenovorans TaxID=53245 RepID=UPI0004903F19|nr:hypothetical protein [Desulfonatronovibrio hydrogenovorans]